MRTFRSEDSAVRWWIKVHRGEALLVRGSSFWDKLHGEWADRCKNPKCDCTEHHPVFSKHDQANIERCKKCSTIWEAKGRGRGIQTSRRSDFEGADLAAFSTIGEVLEKLRPETKRLYLAFLQGEGYRVLALHETRAGRSISERELREHVQDARNIVGRFLEIEGLL